MISYNIPIAEYHASDAISHSKLRTLHEGGPALYYQTYISKTVSRGKRSKDMIFGDFFETYFQRPEEFAANCPVAPAGDGREKGPKRDFLTLMRETKADYIDAEDFEKFKEMRESILEHALACELMAESPMQATVSASYGVHKIQCRPDWISNGCAATMYEPYTIDLKTTSEFNSFSRTALFNYGYYSQAGMARIILELQPQAIRNTRHYLLVVEKDAPFRTSLIRLGNEVLDAGERWCWRSLESIDDCYTAKEWPRTIQGEMEINDVPLWAR